MVGALRILDESYEDPDNGRRLPKTRGDCEGVDLPCNFLSCRHNLVISAVGTGRDAGARVSGLRRMIDMDNPELMEAIRDRLNAGNPTCALDVAEEDGQTLEQIGNIMGLTRERVRQIEEEALDKLRQKLTEAGVDIEAIRSFLSDPSELFKELGEF